MMGARYLRVFCRPPMGVPVEFAGVSTYPDGQPVYGLFDRPVADALEAAGIGGVNSGKPELRLPYDAFFPMPANRDRVSVTDEGFTTVYEVSNPEAEGDGAFLVYALHQRGEPTAALQASADNGQSIASDILDAVVATLGGNAAGVWRCRFRSFAAGDLPATNLLPDAATLQYETVGDVDRVFRFHARHVVMAEDDADKLADARAVQTAQLLAVDPTLGGLVRYVREVGTRWEMEEQDQEMVALVLTFETEFSTRRADPSRPGY